MPVAPTPITALPTPPQRSDSANFAARGDAFLTALPTFRTEVNNLGTNAYNNAVDANNAATTATSNATSAANSAASASASAQAATIAAGVSAWVSGSTYATGASVYSPINYLTYRRTSSSPGSSTTDPSQDATRWVGISGTVASVAMSGGTTGSMLFVAHDPSAETPAKAPKGTYTLAPGATKLPCIVETAMNSDVEGYMTAKVSANVYDTATGRHLLVPQGSTILGRDHSSTLLYGNERLPTVSLTLTLPDARVVDLGDAPITDQQGVAGLTGRVNQHWGRLLGAVFVSGALRGGAQLAQAGAAQGGLSTVTGSIAAQGNQAAQQRIGRALDTRPTIEVASGQVCQVILIKPLTLQAMWQ